MNDTEQFVPEETIEELREVFGFFDRDGNGTISMEELVESLKMLGQTPSQMEIDEMVHEIDVNRDGLIDFQEFQELMLKKMKSTDSTEDIKEIFSIFDAEDKGFFTPPEVYAVMTGMGEKVSPEEALEMFKAAHPEKADRITYEEFCHLVKVMVTK